MSPRRAAPAGRRTAAGGRFGATGLLAVLLPLLLVAGAFGLKERSQSVADTPPTERAVSATNLVCPGGGGRTVTVAGLGADPGEGASGEAEVTPMDGGSDGEPLQLDGVARTQVDEQAVRIRATDELAAGLVATRATADRGSVARCLPGATDQWFTGAGARADVGTVLELSNPDHASAVADIEVLGENGPVEADGLRGIRVPPLGSVTVDLADDVPERSDLALRVVSVQGRVLASAMTNVDPIGSGESGSDWLPASAAPATETTLMALPAVRTDDRRLLVANPGDSEARVSLRLVDDRSSFEPTGRRETRIRPGSVAAVDLAGLQLRDVRAIELSSNEPITASLRVQAGADVSYAAPATPIETRAGVALPPSTGPARVILTGAEKAGVVTVRGLSAGGEQILDKRVEVSPGRAFGVQVPAKVAALEVVPERTTVAAALLLGGDRTAVVPLSELDSRELVPAIRPAQP